MCNNIKKMPMPVVLEAKWSIFYPILCWMSHFVLMEKTLSTFWNRHTGIASTLHSNFIQSFLSFYFFSSFQLNVNLGQEVRLYFPHNLLRWVKQILFRTKVSNSQETKALNSKKMILSSICDPETALTHYTRTA